MFEQHSSFLNLHDGQEQRSLTLGQHSNVPRHSRVQSERARSFMSSPLARAMKAEKVIRIMLLRMTEYSVNKNDLIQCNIQVLPVCLFKKKLAHCNLTGSCCSIRNYQKECFRER